MNYDEPVYFYSSEEIFPKAKEIFDKYEKRLKEILPPECEIIQMGSSAVPGMMSKEDVDIQIRSSLEDFEFCEKVLRENFETKHEDKWKEHSAIFVDSDVWQVDIVLTVAGSDRDHYSKVTETLLNNPELIKEYNELKKKFNGKPYGEYKEAKKDFIYSILEK